MQLAYDISRCLSAADGTCPRRKTCARWMVPGREGGPQPFSAYPGGEDCHAYIDMNETDS